MNELRKDLVYCWDQCRIIFIIEGMEDPELARKAKWPSGWALHLADREHMWKACRFTFLVTGPPQAADAAQVRAILNLIAAGKTP